MSTRILLVDDHPMICSGLRRELSRQPSFEVLKEDAADGATALRLAGELMPDLVVLDLHLPDIDGVLATRQMRAMLPEVKVIIFSANVERLQVDKALQAGASGYVLKSSAVLELIKAINMVMAGGMYVSPEVSSEILADYRRALIGQTAPSRPLLTESEKRLLRLIVNGDRNKEIAEQLNVSTSSVETYRSRLRKKLGCDSTAELVRYAINNNICDC